MWTHRLMWIAWPAFLMAGLLEMLVFALVDPQDLHWFGQPLALSRQGVYTLAFFAFWAITMASSALTTLLALSPFELDRCPVPAAWRPGSAAWVCGSVTGLLAADDAPERIGVEDAHMALFDLHDAFFDKLGESTAHGFELEAEVAADFLARHAQHQLE